MFHRWLSTTIEPAVPTNFRSWLTTTFEIIIIYHLKWLAPDGSKGLVLGFPQNERSPQESSDVSSDEAKAMRLSRFMELRWTTEASQGAVI